MGHGLFCKYSKIAQHGGQWAKSVVVCKHFYKRGGFNASCLIDILEGEIFHLMVFLVYNMSILIIYLYIFRCIDTMTLSKNKNVTVKRSRLPVQSERKQIKWQSISFKLQCKGLRSKFGVCPPCAPAQLLIFLLNTSFYGPKRDFLIEYDCIEAQAGLYYSSSRMLLCS